MFSNKNSINTPNNDIFKLDIISKHIQPIQKNSIDKIDLLQTTFMIPLRIDNNDRMINLEIQLKYLLCNFNTNIIIIENGPIAYIPDVLQNKLDGYNISCINYEFQKTDDTLFHRMKIINECLKKVTTPVCSICDIDVLLPIESYIKTQTEILNGNYDMISPFHPDSRYIYFVLESYKHLLDVYNIETQQKYSKFLKTIKIMNFFQSVGFIIFFNTEKYKEIGGEDENFIGWGPEDRERILRCLYNKFKYGRIMNELYHLEHYRGQNSTEENPFFKSNSEYYDKQYEKYNHEKLDFCQFTIIP